MDCLCPKNPKAIVLPLFYMLCVAQHLPFTVKDFLNPHNAFYLKPSTFHLSLLQCMIFRPTSQPFDLNIYLLLWVSFILSVNFFTWVLFFFFEKRFCPIVDPLFCPFLLSFPHSLRILTFLIMEPLLLLRLIPL